MIAISSPTNKKAKLTTTAAAAAAVPIITAEKGEEIMKEKNNPLGQATWLLGLVQREKESSTQGVVTSGLKSKLHHYAMQLSSTTAPVYLIQRICERGAANEEEPEETSTWLEEIEGELQRLIGKLTKD